MFQLQWTSWLIHRPRQTGLVEPCLISQFWPWRTSQVSSPGQWGGLCAFLEALVLKVSSRHSVISHVWFTRQILKWSSLVFFYNIWGISLHIDDRKNIFWFLTTARKGLGALRNCLVVTTVIISGSCWVLLGIHRSIETPTSLLYRKITQGIYDFFPAHNCLSCPKIHSLNSFWPLKSYPQALFLEGWDITVVSDSCSGS